MTDITDIQRMEVRNTARIILDKPYDHSAPACELASFILATVDAPAPTLAERIEAWAEKHYSGVVGTGKHELLALATRAEKIEEERDELSAELTRTQDDLSDANDLYDQMETAWSETQRERDEARAEVAEWKRRTDHARAEVERLTAERTSKESLPVDQGSNYLEKPNSSLSVVGGEYFDDLPANIPAGEAWEVIATDPAKSFGGTNSYNSTAFRTTDRRVVNRQCHQTPLIVPDDCVHLVRRLVPAPRVITNPDEFDTLAEGAIVRGGDGHAWENVAGKWCGHRAFGAISTGALANFGPVTVLWEPEA